MFCEVPCFGLDQLAADWKVERSLLLEPVEDACVDFFEVCSPHSFSLSLEIGALYIGEYLTFVFDNRLQRNRHDSMASCHFRLAPISTLYISYDFYLFLLGNVCSLPLSIHYCRFGTCTLETN